MNQQIEIDYLLKYVIELEKKIQSLENRLKILEDHEKCRNWTNVVKHEN